MSVLLSLRLSIEFNSFRVVNNFSVIYWLSIVFLSRSSYTSSVNSGLGHGSSSDRVVVDISGLSSVDVYDLFNSLNGRLNVSLSNGDLSWNFNIYGFVFSLVVNDSVSGDSLSVDGSVYNFSSLYWSLDNSLNDGWLLNDCFCDYWLRNDLSGDYRFGFDSLGLGNYWFRVVGLDHV